MTTNKERCDEMNEHNGITTEENDRLERIELLLIAVIECLMNSSQWRKASSDYWMHTTTEVEQQLAEDLITEYRQ